MLVGISSNSLVVKKDACYALKNFTFCAECHMLEDFYLKNREVVRHLVDNLDEAFDNIVTPSLGTLENLLYVFEKDRERTDVSGKRLNLVLEDCKELNLGILKEKLSSSNEVVQTISTRMWNTYFEGVDGFYNENGGFDL